jgi:hypothetical protein
MLSENNDDHWVQKGEKEFKKRLQELTNEIVANKELQLNPMMAYKKWVELLHESWGEKSNNPIINNIAHNQTQTYLLFRIFCGLVNLTNGGAEADAKSEVLQLLREQDKGQGVPYKDLVTLITHIDEDDIENAILQLLEEGLIYEPTPGYYGLL